MLSESALNDKLKAWLGSPAGKAKAKAYTNTLLEKGGKTAGGSKVLGFEDMEMAASKFIHVLYTICSDLVQEGKMPQSVANIIMDAEYSHPIKMGDGKYAVYLWFSDLQRESLENDYKDYGGIDNILALFNNGYHAHNYVFGWWNGHEPTTGEGMLRAGPGATYAWVRSKKDREPLQFMQQAKIDFNGNYGTEFGNPDIELGSDYK